MCEHFKHVLEGGWCEQRQARGRRHDSNETGGRGVAALGDGRLVEGPDGATLILCFGQQESIRQNTIAFTHNNKNGS